MRKWPSQAPDVGHIKWGKDFCHFLKKPQSCDALKANKFTVAFSFCVRKRLLPMYIMGVGDYVPPFILSVLKTVCGIRKCNQKALPFKSCRLNGLESI